MLTIETVNNLTPAHFLEFFGGVFEHSPWVAKASLDARPFTDLTAMHQAMCQVLREAPLEKQLQVIIAHPDLGARLTTLTAASVSEQTAAGLTAMTENEIAAFQQNNTAYREKFGFPFVICARLNNKSAILEAFTQRLQNERPQEIRTAVAEIEKIADLRLRSLIAADD